MRTAPALVLVALALAGCVASQGPRPPSDGPPAEPLKFTDCGTLSLLVPVDAESAEREFPPGFTARIQDSAISGSLLGLSYFECGKVNGHGLERSDVRVFYWTVLVSPPAPYRSEDVTNYGLSWQWTSDDPLARVFEEWKIGGMGEMEATARPLAAGHVTYDVRAANATISFTLELQHQEPEATPSDDEPGQITRDIAAWNGQVIGIVDGRYGELKNPISTGAGSYSVQGGAGVFEARPSGHGASRTADEPTWDWEMMPVPLPEASG